MDVVSDPLEGDQTLTIKKLRFFLDADASRMLENAEINYSDESGFTISGLKQSSCC